MKIHSRKHTHAGLGETYTAWCGIVSTRAAEIKVGWEGVNCETCFESIGDEAQRAEAALVMRDD